VPAWAVAFGTFNALRAVYLYGGFKAPCRPEARKKAPLPKKSFLDFQFHVMLALTSFELTILFVICKRSTGTH